MPSRAWSAKGRGGGQNRDRTPSNGQGRRRRVSNVFFERTQPNAARANAQNPRIRPSSLRSAYPPPPSPPKGQSLPRPSRSC
ncbi:hypothetical protein LY76DRAFT_349204 [Colletotrichum caudatum]|nr:hypothetical protein LY76DRAFT_349204 [Colletotrichum caudatum]